MSVISYDSFLIRLISILMTPDVFLYCDMTAKVALDISHDILVLPNLYLLLNI